MALKYKAGDQVRIKSLDWYNKNIKNNGIIICGSESFTHPMSHFCDKVVTIVTIQDDCYRILEDDGDWYWTDEMIEGLVEEEVDLIPKFGEYSDNEPLDVPTMTTDFVKEHGLSCPEGYQFVDENGNVINTQKIILEKKKKEYPKTYEECCRILQYIEELKVYPPFNADVPEYDVLGLFNSLEALRKLLICRDAYWKIAGEEMGLGKPWELSIGTPIYYIYYNRTVGTIKNDYADDIQGNIILAFPTKEMRDAFYENFKELIETVKELL